MVYLYQLMAMYSTVYTADGGSSIMDKLIDLFSSNAALTAIIGVVAIALVKAGIAAFKLGLKSKSELVLKTEFYVFQQRIELSIAEGFKVMKQDVIDMVKTMIYSELKDLDDIRKLARSTEVNSKVIDEKIRLYEKKFDDIDNINDSIRVLSNTVRRLEFGEKADTQVQEKRTLD